MKKELLKLIRNNQTISAICGYFVLTLAFTFPLVLHINNEIPKGGGDVYQVIATIDARVAQLQTLNTFQGIIFLIKQIDVFVPYALLNLVFSKMIAYNIIFILTYVLSGLGMFLLARYFTKNSTASFVAGLIFAFSPFHYYQSVAVHLGSMQQQWLPFLALYLFRFFEKFRLKYFFATGIFAFLVAMSEHQLLAFTAIFIGLFVAYKIILDRSVLRNWKFWAYAACSLGLLGIVAFGMFGGLLKVATSENNFLDPGANAANRYAIKFLDPLMPPINHAFWSSASDFLQRHVLGSSNRGSYFISFSAVGILGYLLYRLRRRDAVGVGNEVDHNNLYFWFGATFLFYIFSLGNSFSIGKITIYLPYYLIYKFLPFYENIRTTGRMFVFAMLGMSILFAYGCVQLFSKYPQKRILYASALAGLILLEFWVAPIPLMSISYSRFYDEIAKDGQQYNLIEIPGSTNYEFASYVMFTATVHKKAMLNGMPLARKIRGEFDMQQTTPVIKQLLYTLPKGNDPDKKNPPEYYKQANNILNQHNVRYITISKKFVTSKVLTNAEGFIEKYVKYDVKYEDDYLVAYKVSLN